MRSLAYRPDIDGLRALAILCVVLFHAFPEQFPAGFIGVDIFFVISGYLITRIIAGSLAAGTFSFAEFYVRRIRRIFPALVLVLASIYALGWALFGAEDFRQLSKHAIAGATFTSNFLLWQEAGYFDAAAESKPFLHLWSLAIEEQFYLAWPLLLWLARQWRNGGLAVAIAVGCISFLANVHGVFNDPDGAFYSPASRFWELMIGCWLALDRKGAAAESPRRRADMEAFAGLAMIAAALCLLSKESAFPGAWALLPTVGAALLLRSGPDTWLHRTVFAWKPMVGLGLISYSLYLWHWPLLAYLNLRNPDGTPAAIRLAAVLLAVALAWFTYRVVERKIRFYPGRAAIPLLLGLSSLMALTAFAGYRADLGPHRELEARLQAALAWPENDAEGRQCREKHGIEGYCRIAKPAAAPTHALIGDSQADQFFPGFAAEIGRSGGNLIHLGGAGCAPLQGVETNHRPGCKAIIGKALALVLADKDIRTVILAANWHPYAEGTRFSAYQNRQASKLKLRADDYGADADNATVFVAALSRTVALLESGGKKVVFVKQAPELAIRFETCIDKLRAAPAGVWDDRDCAVARSKVDRYVGEYTGLVDQALSGKPRVIVLDPLDVLCDQAFCRAVVHAELMYRDDVHLSVAGSRHVAEKLWPASVGAAPE